MDILAAGIAPNPIPGLTGCENQKIIPYRKNLETSSLSTSGSEKTHELYKSEGSDITFEASRGPRRIRSSHSVLAPPDCHSTPRFRFPKHPRDHQSLPPYVYVLEYLPDAHFPQAAWELECRIPACQSTPFDARGRRYGLGR